MSESALLIQQLLQEKRELQVELKEMKAWLNVVFNGEENWKKSLKHFQENGKDWLEWMSLPEEDNRNFQQFMKDKE
jgi:hypothetical protein